MYQCAPTAMGFTFPAGLTSLVKGIAGAVVRGTTVTIPTPIGPQTFNVGDPAQREQLLAMIKGTKVNVATPQPGAPFNLPRSIEQNVPGGWATIAIAGVALIFGLGLLGGRRRARA